MIAFDDGALPGRAALAVPCRAGPAMALAPRDLGDVTYRGDGAVGPWLAVDGTPEQVRRRLEARIAGLDALGVVVLSLTSSPIAAVTLAWLRARS